MPYIDIQRQNYIADIRASIVEIDLDIAANKKDLQQIDDLMEYCKANKLRKFRRKVVMQERKIALRREKELTRRRADFVKLLARAEKYAPGKGWRK